MHTFAKRIATRCTELSQRLDKDYGVCMMPVILLVTLVGVPFMFIEMLTWEKPSAPVCDHRIDNKRANYRKDPYCSRCGKPLCTSRNEYGGVCLLLRGHDGLHRNPYLKQSSEWRAHGSTLINNEAE
jgi:hypothetical protein